MLTKFYRKSFYVEKFICSFIEYAHIENISVLWNLCDGLKNVYKDKKRLLKQHANDV